MEDNHNIDKLFQSGLENYEMKPPVNSWTDLQASLEKKKPKKKKIFFWRWFSVALLISIGGYLVYNFTRKSPENSDDADRLNIKNESAATTDVSILNEEQENKLPVSENSEERINEFRQKNSEEEILSAKNIYQKKIIWYLKLLLKRIIR